VTLRNGVEQLEALAAPAAPDLLSGAKPVKGDDV
jgi:hypothetical protein